MNVMLTFFIKNPNTFVAKKNNKHGSLKTIILTAIINLFLSTQKTKQCNNPKYLVSK